MNVLATWLSAEFDRCGEKLRKKTAFDRSGSLSGGALDTAVRISAIVVYR